MDDLQIAREKRIFHKDPLILEVKKSMPIVQRKIHHRKNEHSNSFEIIQKTNWMLY